MEFIGFIICIGVIAITAILLYRRFNPQGVLIIAGLLMVSLAALMGLNPIAVNKPSGSVIFDLVQVIDDGFVSNVTRIGLMIMTIGGYVAFMNKIKATDSLVYIALKPLAFFRKYPYLASVMAIPIGQVLFMTIPSAAGLGLLLVASFYPVLVSLGCSRMTALSVIAAATIFDQGPGSANTAMAASLIGIPNVEYFVTYQLPIVVPTTVIVMILYYFSNRHFDRKEMKEGRDIFVKTSEKTVKPDVPLIYAILPMLPLILLVAFSEYVGLFDIHLSTTVAMLFSLIVSVVFMLLFKRNFRDVIDMLDSFWKGMGTVFSSVVTLIVSAEIFSKGLISLGFIDTLVSGSTHLGFSGAAISILITVLIFMAAMLMGSGNAAFFSFGPLMPDIAPSLGMSAPDMILPMQLSASMGRATSPIAGIIVAIAGIAGVSPVELAKRNIPPLVGGLMTLLLFHFLL
ncbi:MAG TPA: C4-dicarboxylate transporter DcuC [Bacteroidales bacterium]|nr:C4-dicarboxylate transporter DcuC [Bacteroidales bacterium]HQJ83577.1 C4-dicarboxylate transporter DcuC [Bacteroidales bacterium]